MTIEETSRQIVEDHYHESLDDMKYPSARKLHANIQKALQQQIDEIVKMVKDENYKLEEWYSSSDRPNKITHFDANQKNIETRNIIIKNIKNL